MKVHLPIMYRTLFHYYKTLLIHSFISLLIMYLRMKYVSMNDMNGSLESYERKGVNEKEYSIYY